MTGLLTTLMWGAVSFSVEVPEVVANQDSSCTKSDTLSKRVDFADLHRARNILGHKDPWAKQLSDFDLGARQKTAEPTSLHEFLDFAADAGLGWTAQEEAGWKALVDKLSDAMEGLNLDVPNIDLVKTTGAEEFDAAYTRGHAIMLPEAGELPAHDGSSPRLLPAGARLFHVLSRADSQLRDTLYALLGFKIVKRFEYPPSSRIAASAIETPSSTYTQ